MTNPRFSVRDLCLVMVALGISLTWWIDRRQLAGELAAVRHASAMNANRPRTMGSTFGSAKQPAPRPTSELSAEEFITALRQAGRWEEFEAKVIVPFVGTAAAEEALPEIIGLLNSRDEIVRTRALATLGRMSRNAKTIVPAIIPLLDDPIPNVRFHAAFALGMFGAEGRPAAGALRKQIADPQSPIAAFAATTLEKIDPTIDAEPVLIAMLSNPLLENRKQAVVDLATSDTNSAQVKAALIEAFGRETDPDTRDRIAQLVERIGLREHPELVKEARAAEPRPLTKPIQVNLHGGLQQKDQRRLLEMVRELNAIDGVAVNILGTESTDPVTEATVRDPTKLLTRKDEQPKEGPNRQMAIVEALRAGGITTIHWDDGAMPED